MAAKPAKPDPDQSRPLDRDEKVKIDLPPTVALHALLKTPPEPEKAPAKPRK